MRKHSLICFAGQAFLLIFTCKFNVYANYTLLTDHITAHSLPVNQ